MPTYDYQCEVNQRVVEVRHGMGEQLSTWQELCECAGIEVGDTPADAPVHKLANGGQVVQSASLGSGPACGAGGGGCGGCPMAS
ncbi:zinc ribbon domain-containing protein [Aestuariirhabdus litorea]|uniref:Zinc ribbon domain-containing protein n=1 Tax=Aestuariirhabdus litorea TaxID=2528527 RepID=A0A3P3VMV7_9GAMM|nr:zinc ribbon domain-containing protein [Aestuariirhabdus litorea]RRJ83677.1 zinc ribbon domain-containing protein [Aestuariirhabdus litorea]RWW96899.1 zinc ribbon domain-containing protein [Endozoicomonadaceae bacterium GTF-13]